MSDVIVVGAGPSGLAAAFRLQQAGHRVRILERSPQAGGPLRSERRDGFLLDRGAFFIPTTHRAMLQLAAEAGIADQLRPGGDVFAAARGGRLHTLDTAHPLRAFARTELLSSR